MWLIATPFLLIFSFKNKHKKSLPARFFLLNNKKLKDSNVHFHACSYGEVSAIEPIFRAFDESSITTITTTGLQKAEQISKNFAYLPFENFLPFWLNKSKVLVIFEAELWLNLVRVAKKNGSYVILLSARISDRSYKSYKFFKFYYKKVFENIDLVLAQSQKDADRLKELGAKFVQIAGNIKSANTPKPTKFYDKFDKKRLIVIASTHESEEELILSNIKFGANDRIILAPRHPERFEKVANIMQNYAKIHALSFEKFSQNAGLESDLILLDTLGELVNFYNIAEIVILGGSFIDNIGGHNPVEAASFGVKIISGKYFYNQKSLYEMVGNIHISEAEDINSALNSELKNSYIIKKFDTEKLINLIKEKIDAR